MITLRGWVLWGLVALVGCKPGDGGDETGDATGAESGDKMTTTAESSVTENASEPTGTPTDPTGTPTDPTGTPTDPTGMPTDPTGMPTDPTGMPAVCDPAGCQDYCEWARCLWDDDIEGAKCRAACEENCGDVSFDDSDRDLMACQAKVTNDFNCADSQACCDELFVNQICPD